MMHDHPRHPARRSVRRAVFVGAITSAALLAVPGAAAATHYEGHDPISPGPVLPELPVTVIVEVEDDHLGITMENIIVSSISIGNAEGDEATPTETVTLNFGDVSVDYTPHDPDEEDGDGKSITVAPWDPDAASDT